MRVKVAARAYPRFVVGATHEVASKVELGLSMDSKTIFQNKEVEFGHQVKQACIVTTLHTDNCVLTTMA